MLEQDQHSAGLRYIIDPVYLDKSNILALLPEALSADIETVFSDQTGFVGADAAVKLEGNRSAGLSGCGLRWWCTWKLG